MGVKNMKIKFHDQTITMQTNWQEVFGYLLTMLKFDETAKVSLNQYSRTYYYRKQDGMYILDYKVLNQGA
jgi:hypothetical protein